MVPPAAVSAAAGLTSLPPGAPQAAAGLGVAARRPEPTEAVAPAEALVDAGHVTVARADAAAADIAACVRAAEGNGLTGTGSVEGLKEKAGNSDGPPAAEAQAARAGTDPAVGTTLQVRTQAVVESPLPRVPPPQPPQPQAPCGRQNGLARASALSGSASNWPPRLHAATAAAAGSVAEGSIPTIHVPSSAAPGSNQAVPRRASSGLTVEQYEMIRRKREAAEQRRRERQRNEARK